MQSKQSRDRQGAVTDSTLYANCESAEHFQGYRKRSRMAARRF
jgi:hypothetical protein